MNWQKRLWLSLLLMLLSLLFWIGGGPIAPQSNQRLATESPVEVVLAWGSWPRINGSTTLTAEVTSEVDADNLTLKWVVPDGIALSGSIEEALGPIRTGQTIIRQREVTFDQVGTFKVVVGAQMETAAPPAHWGDSEAVYFTIEPGTGSRASRRGPGLASNEEHIEVEVTYSPANHPDGGYDISGYINYVDIPVDQNGALTPTLVPARRVKIKVMEYDPIWDDYEGTTYTEDDGYFSFHIGNNDDGWLSGDKETYIKFYPNNPGAYVTDRSGIDEDYVVVTDYHSGGSDLWFGTVWPVDFNPMFNIADAILDGYLYVSQYRDPPGKVQVQYEPDYGQDGSFYDPYWDEITIEDAGGDDAYDHDVILHEYGHYLADNYSCDTSPGGDHNVSKHYSRELAYSEGWANYFSSAVRGSSWYRDWNFDTDGWGVAVNWEPWTILGNTNEGAVCASLWDIHDPANEPHDRLEAGGDEIWDVFDNRMEYQYPFVWYFDCTIDMFYYQWDYAGHGADSDVAAIFGQYAISPTGQTATTVYDPPAGSAADRSDGAHPATLDSTDDPVLFEDQVPWEAVLFLVDNTQSMDNEIASIKTIIQDRVSSMETEPEAVQFTVETFNDTGANTLVVNDFWPDIVNPAVADITVGGGGDLSEDTMEALGRGTRFRHGFNAWLFTDAPPHVPRPARQSQSSVTALPLTDWVGSTVATMQRRKVTPYFFLFGNCNDENLSQEANAASHPDSFQECVETYLLCAEGTGGQFMFLDTSEVEDATEIVRALMTNNAMAGRFNYRVSSTDWQYQWDDAEYAWYDATGGTWRQILDREAVALPQSFSFYNVPYNTAYVAQGGYVSFSDFPNDSDNTGLPTAALPNNAIYGFWDNISNIINQGEGVQARMPGIYTDHDTTDNRFVIEYHDNYHVGGSPYENFEVILDLDSDEIVVQYAEVGDDASTTVGVENADGTVGTQVAFNNEGFLYPGRAIQFTPIPPGPRNHEALADSTMASISFFLNGYEGTVNMTLYRPDGTPVDPDDPDVTYINVSKAEYYRLDDPAAGTYTTTVSGDGTYYFTSVSESTLDTDLIGDHTLPMGEASLLLDLGMTLTVQPDFSLVDRRGMVVDTLVLYDDGAHDDGEASDGLYGGDYTPLMPGTFYLQVEGQTPTGEPFRRLDLVPLTFQQLQMWISGSDTRFAEPDSAELYTFVVQNWSPFTHTFGVYLDSTQGWAATTFYTKTIPAGNWGIIPVTVWVPTDTNGLVDETTVGVFGAGMAEEYVATTIARGPVDEVATEAHPAEIQTGGYTSTIVAYVEDDQSWAVADGTEVLFETTLGSIDPVTATTVNGVATATLTSEITAGTALVRATGDMAASEVVEVEISPPAACTLTLTAADSQLPANGISTTLVTAYVYDEYGNPAPDGSPVVFGVEGDDMAMGTVEGAEVYTGTTSGGMIAVTYRVSTTVGQARMRAEILPSGGPGPSEGFDGRSATMTILLFPEGGYQIFLPIVSK